MAGDWMKWSKGLSRKPEVLQMASLLGCTAKHMAALCMEFWEWGDDNVEPEDESAICPGVVRLASANSALVDDIVGAPGFADAMISVGWLTIRNGRIEFPKFGRHNGKHAKRRALEQERKRSSRQHSPQDGGNLSASHADKKRTRGEERREEIKKATPSSKSKTPTLEEVRAYFAEKQTAIDPEQFFAHYDANGWRQANGNPLKNWRSALVTWEKNRTHERKGTHANRNPLPAGPGQKYDGTPLGGF